MNKLVDIPMNPEHKCRFRETDRTGLYIMVFLILMNSCQSQLSRSDVRAVVQEELAKLPIYQMEQPSTNLLENVDITIEKETQE